MDKKEWKNNLIRYSRNNQEIIALFVALVALIIAISILFSHDGVGVLDYGEYTQTLYDMGLSYTEDSSKEDSSLRYETVIEKFKVEQIQVLQFLQLKPSQSLTYPVTMISIVCKLLRVPFSTKYLAFLLMICTVGCIYSITKSAYCFFKEKAAAIGLLSCFILLCGNDIIYFNSLYRNGIYYVSFLAFFTILLHIIATKGRSQKPVACLLFVSLLLLNSVETAIVYLPLVIVTNVWAMIKSRPKKEKQITYLICCLLVLGFVIRSNILYTIQNEALFSNTQLYHSFFTGVLEESGEKEELLKELSIDPALSADIGKNAYLAKNEYVLDPNGEEAKEKLFSHLSYTKLLAIYWKHPELYVAVLKNTAANIVKIDTTRFLAVNRRADEGTEWVERFVWWQWVRTILLPKTLIGYSITTLTMAMILAVLLFLYRRDKEKRALFFFGMLSLAFFLAQFFILYAWQGFAEESSLAYYVILPFDVFLIILGALLIKGMEEVRKIWNALFLEEMIDKELELEGSILKSEPVLIEIDLSDSKEEQIQEIEGAELVSIQEPGEEIFLPNPLWQICKAYMLQGKALFTEKILRYPSRAAFLFMVIVACIVFCVLFVPNRIGAYNNGDFGRMMNAMNLKYTSKDWQTPEELSLTKVVEKYDWADTYDYSKIMPYNADLSQIWFSLPIKLIDNSIGLTFSTVYVTILYAILIILSVFFIMQVIFHRFGEKAFGLAVILLIILLDLVNLGWLNSLFGEGIAFVSLLMLIASTMKIADMERGSCRWSFLYLFFSEILFIGAKAQFTVTTPVLLLGTLVLFLYHRPIKKWKWIPYFSVYLMISVWLLASAVHIYGNNEEISSPDAMYQAVFYGLLMLVDDPKQTLIDLGLDPAMAVDTGKHAFLDKSEYFCPPRTQKAEEMLYSKISTFDILFYYIKHPVILWKAMDITAKAAAEDMPNYVLVVGQKTTGEHDVVNRFHLWGTIRSYVVVHHFGSLVLIYGMECFLTLKYLWNKNKNRRDKLLLGMFFMISFIGIIQFPLTFIGNGYADNTKQLYIFRLTYDITVVTGIFLLLPTVKSFFDQLSRYVVLSSKKKSVK